VIIDDLNIMNTYQCDGLALMSSGEEDNANWLANHDRNIFGGIMMGLMLLISFVSMLVLAPYMPVVFFSPLFSIILPVAVASSAILILMTALIYAKFNQDSQVDNRYKLFTGGVDGKNKEIDTLHVPDELLTEVARP
jgi:hypothetical protein